MYLCFWAKNIRYLVKTPYGQVICIIKATPTALIWNCRARKNTWTSTFRTAGVSVAGWRCVICFAFIALTLTALLTGYAHLQYKTQTELKCLMLTSRLTSKVFAFAVGSWLTSKVFAFAIGKLKWPIVTLKPKGVVWEKFECVQTCCFSIEVDEKHITPSIPRNRYSVPAKPKMSWY